MGRDCKRWHSSYSEPAWSCSQRATDRDHCHTASSLRWGIGSCQSSCQAERYHRNAWDFNLASPSCFPLHARLNQFVRGGSHACWQSKWNKSQQIQAARERFMFDDILPHASYCHDLAPCDFFILHRRNTSRNTGDQMLCKQLLVLGYMRRPLISSSSGCNTGSTLTSNADFVEK